MMRIPEWEVEDALAWNPSLLSIPHAADLHLIGRQKYLKKLGRYVDLLFRQDEKIVLVEVKSDDIDDDEVVYQQILPYKQALLDEFRGEGIRLEPVLAISGTISKEVREACRKEGITVRLIDREDIIQAKPPDTKSLAEDENLEHLVDILRLRGLSVKRDDLQQDDARERYRTDIRSVKTWMEEGVHDRIGKRKIAKLFRDISREAPIMAHEVGTDSSGELETDEGKWFWLFYSVLDRRSNAATFIKARKALEDEGLFSPEKIVQMVEDGGETETLEKIHDILKGQGFPLIVDKSYGDRSAPKSIVDAALLIAKYNYDFSRFYQQHYEAAEGDLEETLASIRSEIRENVYGAGPRITSQFIRGMVLKGDWHLPLSSSKFLERCKFNEAFAGPLRLNLVEEGSYKEELGKFADDYLGGNKAIISHVLWYIRRRYCHRKPDCNHCVAAGFCRHYLKVQYNLHYSQKKSRTKGGETEYQLWEQTKLPGFDD